GTRKIGIVLTDRSRIDKEGPVSKPVRRKHGRKIATILFNSDTRATDTARIRYHTNHHLVGATVYHKPGGRSAGNPSDVHQLRAELIQGFNEGLAEDAIKFKVKDYHRIQEFSVAVVCGIDRRTGDILEQGIQCVIAYSNSMCTKRERRIFEIKRRRGEPGCIRSQVVVVDNHVRSDSLAYGRFHILKAIGKNDHVAVVVR